MKQEEKAKREEMLRGARELHERGLISAETLRLIARDLADPEQAQRLPRDFDPTKLNERLARFHYVVHDYGPNGVTLVGPGSPTWEWFPWSFTDAQLAHAACLLQKAYEAGRREQREKIRVALGL